MAEDLKLPQELEQTNAETQSAPVAGETTAPRGRAALRGRYKEKYPDRNWDEEDDDALADQAMADYDEADGALNKYKERDKNLDELFKNNPNSSAFLMDMAEGGEDDVLERVYKHFGEDIVAAMEDPDEREKLKKIREKKQADLAKAAEEARQWESNMQDSIKTLEDYKQSNGLDDGTVEQMLTVLDKITSDLNAGQIESGTLDILLKAIGYDADIAKAKTQGERNGRNARIDEGMRRRKNDNSGVPSLGGSSGNASSKPLTRGGGGFGNTGAAIWQAGNIKRHNYE